jgi:hypothetical protein
VDGAHNVINEISDTVCDRVNDEADVFFRLSKQSGEYEDWVPTEHLGRYLEAESKRDLGRHRVYSFAGICKQPLLGRVLINRP